MEKNYLVTGCWRDKQSGKILSRLANINSGVNKGGYAYQFADTENSETIEGNYPVGTIFTATMNFAIQNPTEESRNSK